MDLKTYIEMGEKKAGKQVDLANILETRDSTLRLAKTGHSKLPDYICYKLATYLEIEAGSVIAASNLVTEKDEKKRRVFEDYLKKSGERATAMIVGAVVISMLTMAAPRTVEAGFSQQSYNNANYTKLNMHSGDVKTPVKSSYVKSKICLSALRYPLTPFCRMVPGLLPFIRSKLSLLPGTNPA